MRKTRRKDIPPKRITVYAGVTGVLTLTQGKCPLGRNTCTRYKRGQLYGCLDLGDTSAARKGIESETDCYWKPPVNEGVA